MLERTIDLIAFDGASLEEAIRVPLDRAGIDLAVQFASGLGLERTELSGLFPAMRLADYLLALADRYGVCFVLRDYGFLVTTPDRGRQMRGPAIPADLSSF